MRTFTVRLCDGGGDVDDGGGPVGVAGSVVDAHWVAIEPGQRDHGGGRSGRSMPAGRLTVVSLVRRAWEVRLSRVDRLAYGVDPTAVRLRVGGWPVAGRAEARADHDSVTVTADGLVSRLCALRGAGRPGVTEHSDGSPLGGRVLVPWLDHAPRVGEWAATLIELSGTDLPRQPGRARLDASEHGLDARVLWPDGVTTHTHISDGLAVPATRQQQGPAAGPHIEGEG